MALPPISILHHICEKIKMKNSTLFLGMTALCIASKTLFGADIAINIAQGALAGIAIYYIIKERKERNGENK